MGRLEREQRPAGSSSILTCGDLCLRAQTLADSLHHEGERPTWAHDPGPEGLSPSPAPGVGQEPGEGAGE